MSKSLAKSTLTVSSMTFVSRMLGFVRDMLAAQIFGVNAAVDAFNVAFKIPNFMRNLFAEGSFQQAFVPVLSDYRTQRTPAEVRQFISHIAAALSIVLLGVVMLGVVGAPLVVKLVSPGLEPYRFELASTMLRITFPYLMLISLTAFTGAILNSYGVFSVAAFTPALLNVCLIGTALGCAQYFKVPIESQAWGVLLAGFVQLGFQLPFIKRLGFLVRPRLNWKDAGVRRVLTLMLPAIFGASVGQISLLLNTIFASFLPIGSISWLYYSERLAYFPLGVFGVALATVVLPQLARQHATKAPAAYARTLDWGIRCNLLIGLPAALTLFVLAGPLVVTLFAYGKFSVHDVMMTRTSVMAYATGLQSFMLVKILASAFYAQQDVRTPVRIAVLTLIVNMLLNIALLMPLKHAGLALASALGSWFNTGLLLYALHKKAVYRAQAGWLKFFMQLLSANGAVVLFLSWNAGDLNVWLHWRWPQRCEHVLLLGSGAIALYLICLWAVGMRPQQLKVQV